ncbi:acrylyl-CoA reductase (NADPH) [Roseiarcus fermentans]|uniref:Acrylyl-CoA reductase (NADPH) n=1 Tax=Roseiarcus fermentans TaxID=1473586 RepID=A0A366EVS5_9HYPH|nr:MDR family oxidoreductase [Roseiarcus fermentans]RBP06434.1 acrylyl-CoA reductase (NADPH) [Roseiarcus fermentans]
MPFKAVRADKTDAGQDVRFAVMEESELMDGDVTVRVSHSTVNYKDGLALSGKSAVIRRFPMVLGIDLAGVVETSNHPGFAPGDEVIVNGYGLSETHFGGYAEKARVKGDWLVKLPPTLSPAEAMAIGTAGYTAMLCVMALERHGATPAAGPVLVTGAAGGVGSTAISLLAGRGWTVIASTGRASEADYLRGLGAAEIIDRATLSAPGKPLGKELWAAAVDSVGSTTLANVLAQTRYGGAVAACGLAGGMDLPATVVPFILRSVALLGVDSVQRPMPDRIEAWARLAVELDRTKLAAITHTIAFDQVFDAGRKILAGEIRGRTVVTIG